MKKILLTSAGFENKNIADKFLELVNKNVKEIKVLFITTAAIELDAIKVLPKCLEDLLNCGVEEKNITVYDMHKPLSNEEIIKYDAIYMCGGKTSYLVERLNEKGFKEMLNYFINNSKLYIGVSAGSVAASGNYPNGLNLLKNKLEVHCDKGSINGVIQTEDTICLTNNQAILINDDELLIFE